VVDKDELVPPDEENDKDLGDNLEIIDIEKEDKDIEKSAKELKANDDDKSWFDNMLEETKQRSEEYAKNFEYTDENKNGIRAIGLELDAPHENIIDIGSIELSKEKSYKFLKNIINKIAKKRRPPYGKEIILDREPTYDEARFLSGFWRVEVVLFKIHPSGQNILIPGDGYGVEDLRGSRFSTIPKDEKIEWKYHTHTHGKTPPSGYDPNKKKGDWWTLAHLIQNFRHPGTTSNIILPDGSVLTFGFERLNNLDEIHQWPRFIKYGQKEYKWEILVGNGTQ